MKNKMALIIVSIIIIFAITIAILIITSPTSKYSIIKNFKDNKELFEQSIEELSKEGNIYCDRVYNTVIIQKYDNEQEQTIRVKEENLGQYEHTINLMRKLEIKSTFGDTFQKQVDLFEKRSIIKKSSWED